MAFQEAAHTAGDAGRQSSELGARGRPQPAERECAAGAPKEAGLYVIRAKFAPHTMSRPHWHPEARYVVVIKGTWWAGEGDKLDPARTVPVPTGSFAVHPPRLVHYDGAKDEEVIVQITGIGPSGTHVVTP